jgi:hypothetical protein
MTYEDYPAAAYSSSGDMQREMGRSARERYAERIRNTNAADAAYAQHVRSGDGGRRPDNTIPAGPGFHYGQFGNIRDWEGPSDPIPNMTQRWGVTPSQTAQPEPQYAAPQGEGMMAQSPTPQQIKSQYGAPQPPQPPQPTQPPGEMGGGYFQHMGRTISPQVQTQQTPGGGTQTRTTFKGTLQPGTAAHQRNNEYVDQARMRAMGRGPKPQTGNVMGSPPKAPTPGMTGMGGGGLGGGGNQLSFKKSYDLGKAAAAKAA